MAALRFRRIQFTPDLLPTDITGTYVLAVDEATGRKNYRFIRGPVFTDILLVDEIHRPPPKTQAAQLAATQEIHLPAAGETYLLTPPNLYPLREAQLDRFMFSLRVDYQSEAEVEEIAQSTTSDRSVTLFKRMSGEEILQLQKLVRRLPVFKTCGEICYTTRARRSTPHVHQLSPRIPKG